MSRSPAPRGSCAFLFTLLAIAACAGGRAGVVNRSEIGLGYIGTSGYVGHPMGAELENDRDRCPLPWVSTVRGVEGELPPGLALMLPHGRIEGTPLEAGAWTFRVLLDDVTCGGRDVGSVGVPVTITIRAFERERAAAGSEDRSPPICTGSRAHAVNGRGWIVGRVDFADGSYVAVAWEGETARELGTLGGRSSEAMDIDSRGNIVGTSRTQSGAPRGFLWEDGAMRDLAPLESAVAIDEAGRIAGARPRPGADPVAVVWENGAIRDLGTLGGDGSQPNAMNDSGTVVGTSTAGDGKFHAFAWERGEMRDLGEVGAASMAFDVNEPGHVVGMRVVQSGAWHAAVWEDGRIRDLGAFGSNHAVATGIDEEGRIIVNVATPDDPSRTARILLLDGDEVIDLELRDDPHGRHSAFEVDVDMGVVGATGGRAAVWKDGALRILPNPPTCEEPPADADGDGVGEDVNRCPKTHPSVVVDSEGCPLDSDGDQVPDGLDECAGTPRGTFVDVDGCPIEEGSP